MMNRFEESSVALVQALLNDLLTIDGVNYYGWVEAIRDLYTGEYTPILAGRHGTTTVNYAVELNNATLDTETPFAVWLRQGGLVNGQMIWEFQAPVTGAPGPPAPPPDDAPTVLQSTLCIGGVLYVTSGQLNNNQWYNVTTVPDGCCACSESGSGSGSGSGGVGNGGSANPCQLNAVSVMATFPFVGCATQTMSGVLTFVGNNTWEGTITGGGVSGTIQLKMVGATWVWAVVLNVLGQLIATSGTLTAEPGCILSGITTCNGFAPCVSCLGVRGSIVFGDPCCNSGDGSGSGSGGGTISTSCCPSNLLSTTLTAVITSTAGGCGIIAGTYTLTYNPTMQYWENLGAGPVLHLACVGPTWTLLFQCGPFGGSFGATTAQCSPFAVTFAGINVTFGACCGTGGTLTVSIS